jgi:hypothetical protein
MSTDTQLAELLGRNADLFAAYEEWANGQIMLLAGTVDDPNSFNAEGGKTGSLGYYPVVNVSGQTIYVPSIARLKLLALGGANAEVLEGLIAQVSGVVAIAEQVEAVQAALDQFGANPQQLQALADILVPSGATATFRDPNNLMLLGDML